MIMIQLAIVGDSQPITPPPDVPKLRGDRVGMAIAWVVRQLNWYEFKELGAWSWDTDVWDIAYFLDQINGYRMDELTEDDFIVLERIIQDNFPGGVPMFNRHRCPISVRSVTI